MLEELKKLWRYRSTIWIMTTSNLKLKYASSYLGFLWSILEPLLLILVYSLVFPLILKTNFFEWVLFFICGLLPYRFLNIGFVETTRSIVDMRNIIIKTNIPTEVIPISKALSSAITFLLESVVFFSIVFLSGVQPTNFILLFPVLFVTEFFIILGVGFYLSSLFVRFRDLTYILNIAFQALLFLCPIVYTLVMVPEIYRGVYLLNPISRLILLYQSVILHSASSFIEYLPVLENTVVLFIFSIAVLLIGYLQFNKRKHNFAGEL